MAFLVKKTLLVCLVIFNNEYAYFSSNLFHICPIELQFNAISSFQKLTKFIVFFNSAQKRMKYFLPQKLPFCLEN